MTSVLVNYVALIVLAFPRLSFAVPSEFLNPAQVNKEHELLAELGGLIGHSSVEKRVLELEGLLHPLYITLPKDARGLLEHSTVCYALHRFFTSRHGWSVHGLDPNGGAWNETSVVGVLNGRVPAYVQASFEDYLNERGFGLHELAVLVAALEHLVSIETQTRVEAAYSALKLSASIDLESDEVDEILDTSFLIYMFARDLHNASWITRIKQPHRVYPGWEDTQSWMRDTRQNLAYALSAETNPFVSQSYDFRYVISMVEEISDKHGQYHTGECNELKEILLSHEYKGTGRILLTDFYRLAVAGDWRFSEKIEFLRQLGALDEETDPSSPRLIVANYLYGKSNCVAGSQFYAVCCLDECEGLMNRLGHAICAPEAEPSLIADEVALLSSSTVSAPRNLSVNLLKRLDDIAALHKGTIPFHSRMFAQWMHHAFPRECRYPHISGTFNPVTATEWMSRTGDRATMTKDALQTHAAGLAKADALQQDEQHHDELDELAQSGEDDDWVEAAPWSDHEELVVRRSTASASTGELYRGMIMVGVIASMAVSLLFKTRVARCTLHGDRKVLV